MQVSTWEYRAANWDKVIRFVLVFSALIAPCWTLPALARYSGVLCPKCQYLALPARSPRCSWLSGPCPPLRWALNQTAHSHEFSPVSSLGSQVAQM